MAKQTQTNPLEPVFKELGKDVGRIANGIERIENSLEHGVSHTEKSSVQSHFELPTEIKQLIKLAPELLEGIKLGQRYLAEKTSHQHDWQDFIEKYKDFIANQPDSTSGYQVTWQAKVVPDKDAYYNAVSNAEITVPAHLQGQMGWIIKQVTGSWDKRWVISGYERIPDVIRLDGDLFVSQDMGRIFIIQLTEQAVEIHLKANHLASSS